MNRSHYYSDNSSEREYSEQDYIQHIQMFFPNETMTNIMENKENQLDENYPRRGLGEMRQSQALRSLTSMHNNQSNVDFDVKRH